ncbi:MAG: TetR/AcrR family transcriptional regulator [Nocardioides sp.]|nr:TetR/AcrR family transcriptional regulator [Nocardioides sp.]
MPAPNPKRSEQILAAATELFARKGIAKTTVRDIGEAAGVLSGTLYHYFDSKNAIVVRLLTDLGEENYRRNLAAVDGVADPLEAIRALIRISVALVDEMPQLTSIYQNEGNYFREHDLLSPVEALLAANRKTWLDTVKAAVANNQLRNDLDSLVFYELLRDAIWSCTRWNSPVRVDADELATSIETIFLHGFAAR